MNKKKILIVDDDPVIVKFVRANLVASGYDATSAGDGQAALKMVEEQQPDLVLLDIMMPYMDGCEVCRRLREWSQIPIIMLTARGDEKDKVALLNAGADDYIPKPFGVNELLARIGAVLRRSEKILNANTAQMSFHYKNLDVNFPKHQVICGGKEINLTRTEYNLLQELVLNADKVLTHSHLLHKIWGPEYQGEKEYLHVFVNRLRAKLEGCGESIVTISGVGYEFKTD